MRREYSEGDIQTLGSNNHSNGGGSSASIVTKSEERREKFFRLWEKSKRLIC
ncbi:hypothetical protein IHE45_09G073000 [Dioscorea alata]|uniref:Uncharacterized protein n=1 Tax=Dioscorea alata TaxID=55571 RepID=A0ACB7VFU4_DIOAL|nr:hypothetical protein IHE45_09G073000 [Dioscorea alata]